MNKEQNPIDKGEIVIYQTDDGKKHLDVRLQDDTLWLTQAQLVDLYKTSKSNISEHIKHIFEEGELSENSVVRKFRTTANDGKSYETSFYSLDMIISLGYRIKSQIATRFRIWATERLKEYIIKGFTMDDERLKQGGNRYWKELLERIRDIRSSEKMLYRQVLDLYAESVDYDQNSEESKMFFKIVQNKLHYAAHGHTASEVIYQRVDSEKEFLGLTTFKGDLPTKAEAKTAKNYLYEPELRRLNNLVSAYFDLAELQAQRHIQMRMRDYIEHLDRILSADGDKLLQGGGRVSHEQAMRKVDAEYKKYQQKTITPVERAYLDTIKATQKKISKKNKKNE